MKTRAVILAGGEGSRLGVLTDKRAKPAVPFAGKYRIIDFTLSNCVNSGIADVMILTQYRPALTERAHRRGPAVGPRPRLHGRRPDLPAVPRPRRDRLVQGHRGRDRAEPLLRRARIARHRPRALGRPHLQDELRPADPLPPGAAGGRHDRDAERHARRGDPDGHPPTDPADAGRVINVRREARRPAGNARLDGHLRVRPRDALAGADGGQPAPGLVARLRQGRHPADGRLRAEGLRLSLRGLLGGRRNDRGVLGVPDGSSRGPAAARLERPLVDHPHAVGGAAARRDPRGRVDQGQHGDGRVRDLARAR